MRVLLISNDPTNLEAHRQAVLGLGLECAAEDCIRPDDLMVRLSRVAVTLAVVFVEGDVSRTLPVIEKTRERLQGPVLAAGPANLDPTRVIDILHAGAQKYLDQARFRDEFSLALEDLKRKGAVKVRQGRTIAVTAVNPGAGVSTVAANLAVAMAQKHPQQVALAELANTVPELALMLDVPSKFDIGALVRDAHRMDATMLRQTLVAHPTGVMVLASPQETLTPPPITPPVMRTFVSLLRSLFEFSVIDLGYSLSDSALQAITLADEVVVVVRLEVPSLRLTRLFLRNLVDKGVPVEKIRVVANRYGQSRQFPWKQVQEVLGIPVLVWIPDDSAALNRALNEGHPLMQVSRGTITRRFNELARHLNGAATQAGKTQQPKGTR